MMHLDKRTISNKMNCILGNYNVLLLDSAQCHTGTENVKLKYNSMNDYFVPGTPSELVVVYLSKASFRPIGWRTIRIGQIRLDCEKKVKHLLTQCR